MQRDIITRMKPARLGAGAIAAALLGSVVACAGGGGSPGSAAFLPPQAPAAAAAAGEIHAGGTGIASFTVAIPPAQKSVRGIAVAARRDGAGKALTKFFAIAASAPYCTGTSTAGLTCTLELKVPAGSESFTLASYAGSDAKSKLLAQVALQHAIAAGAIDTIDATVGGEVAYLQIALAIAAPRTGRTAAIPLEISAADARGDVILGAYAKPILLSDSDASGATALTMRSVRSSTQAEEVVLKYDGAGLHEATIGADSATAAAPATVAFTPGSAAIEADPPLLYVVYGTAASAVAISGPKTSKPYAISTSADRFGDRACTGMIAVTRDSSDAFSIASTGGSGECWLATTDAKGHAGSIPVLLCDPGSTATPGPSPSPAGSISVTPSKVALCPSSGSNACDNDAQDVVVSQSGSGGDFTESDDCNASVATVAQASSSGDAATYHVAAQSSLGTCTATFTGSGSKATLSIAVQQPGIIINTRNHLR
ncbi:MAG TPA: hypothetical protein VMH02_02615 [Verrucomicrobiae bacterium]|nr:hypothetical protein [Verrucomicrobiae bacterium]